MAPLAAWEWQAGQAITMMPVFGAFLSAALLGEALQSYHFVGMGCILAGIVLGALAPKPSEAAGAGGTARLEERP
jgi:drug/metabolite transporter (DMT)-like permease